MNTLESYQRERLTRDAVKPISQKTENEVIYEFDPNNPPPLTPKQKAEIEVLRNMNDSEIDYSDIQIQKSEDWEQGIVIGNPFLVPPTKTKLKEFLVDSDIIYWATNQAGAGYMDKLNSMLRRAMEEERAGKKG